MIDTEDCADSYVADGTANPRSIGFRILDPSFLAVFADGVPQILNSDFTVSGDYNGGLGTFTPNAVTPWPAGTEIFYMRLTEALQKAKVLPGVPLPSVDVERELDRRAMIEAELMLANTRTVRAPANEPLAPLPNAAARSGKLQGYDIAGDPVMLDRGDFRGDPGGNVMSIGSFAAATLMVIPIGAQMVQTSEHQTGSRIGYARYVRDDATVTPAFVATYPRAAFRCLDSTGAFAGFRLAETRPTPAMFGAQGTGDDAVAIQAGGDFCAAFGLPYTWDRDYRSAIKFTAAPGLIMRGPFSDNARFLLPVATDAFEATGAIDIDGMVFDGETVDLGHARTAGLGYCLVGIHGPMDGASYMAGVKIGRMRVQNTAHVGAVFANLDRFKPERLEAQNVFNAGYVFSGMRNGAVSAFKADNIGDLQQTGSRRGVALLVSAEVKPLAAWYAYAGCAPVLNFDYDDTTATRTTDTAVYVNDDRSIGVTNVKFGRVRVDIAGKDGFKCRSTGARPKNVSVASAHITNVADSGFVVDHNVDFNHGAVVVENFGIDALAIIFGAADGTYNPTNGGAGTIGNSIITDPTGYLVQGSDNVVGSNVSVKVGHSDPYGGSEGNGVKITSCDTVTLGPVKVDRVDSQAIRISASARVTLQPIVKDTAITSSTKVGIYFNNDVSAWLIGTTYTQGDSAMDGGQAYRSLISGNIGFQPSANLDKWVAVNGASKKVSLVSPQFIETSTTPRALPIRVNGALDELKISKPGIRAADAVLVNAVAIRIDTTATNVDVDPIARLQTVVSVTTDGTGAGTLVIAHGLYAAPNVKLALLGTTGFAPTALYAISDGTNITIKLTGTASKTVSVAVDAEVRTIAGV